MEANNWYLGPLGAEKLLSCISRDVQPSSSMIASETRLASGKLVRDRVANKRTWTFRWDALAGKTTDMDDRGMGRDDLRELYENDSNLYLYVPLEDGTHEMVQVLFGTQFVDKRLRISPYYDYRVQIDLMEV